MATMHRARAVLKIKKKVPVSVTDKAKAMDLGIAAHPAVFTVVNPALSVVAAQTAVVDKANVVAGTHAKGAAAARNVQLAILVGMLETQTNTVQGLADQAATWEQAVSIIELAALTVARVGKRAKPILAITQGPQPGSVVLDANATALAGPGKKKSFFNWGYTLDGGKTFIPLPSTPKARTTLANLTPLTTVGFRVSITKSNGIAGDWSQVVAFLVH